jgi:hypothetical protein
MTLKYRTATKSAEALLTQMLRGYLFKTAVCKITNVHKAGVKGRSNSRPLTRGLNTHVIFWAGGPVNFFAALGHEVRIPFFIIRLGSRGGGCRALGFVRLPKPTL